MRPHPFFLTPALVALVMLGSSHRAPAGTESPKTQELSSFCKADSSLIAKPAVSLAQEFTSGDPGFLKARVEHNSHELLDKCGFSFDAMQSETMPGMYGPTSVMNHSISRHASVWESELLALAKKGSPLTSEGLLHLDGPSSSQEKLSFMTGIPPRFSPDLGAAIPMGPDADSFAPALPLKDSQGLGFQSNSSLALLMMVSVMIVLARVRRARPMAG
jgi:hypothetical protein